MKPMFSSEVSHLVLEFTDHYVIRPTIEYAHTVDYACNALSEKGIPVPEGFEYSSEINTEWLKGFQLLDMLKQ